MTLTSRKAFVATTVLALTTALITLLTGTGQASSQTIDPQTIDSIVEQFVPTPVVATTAPADPSAGFTITSANRTVTFTPVAIGESRLRYSPAGRATYANAYGSTTTVFQREDERSGRIINVLFAADAPQTYTWQLRLPHDTKLVARVDGAVDIVTTHPPASPETIATIDKPWAFDATKKPIPTRYAVDGSQLTQIIDHTSHSTPRYPVTTNSILGVIWGWG